MANIAIVCDREFFSPFDQRVYKEVVSMKKAGHNIEILTPHVSSEIQNYEGIKVRCFSTNGPPGIVACLLYTSPSPRDQRGSRMPSSA